MSTRSCEIVTKLKKTDKNGNEIELITIEKIMETINKRPCITKYAFIVHDKDRYTDEELARNPELSKEDLKDAHLHLMLKFNSPQHFKNIAQWFGVPEQFVEKIHSKWPDALSYLIHRNAPEKYQYPIDAVTANFDYQKAIEGAASESLDDIIESIMDGKIPEYKRTQMISATMLVKCNKQIETAYRMLYEKRERESYSRNMQTLFITGESQSGKTTFAKRIAKEYGECFISSASNDVLFGYADQPIIILDELRPDAMGFADLLKFLDPYTASTVKSRYRNRVVTNCKLVIITSILEIEDFYDHICPEMVEPILQLKRRCQTYIHMDINNILVSYWDAEALAYTSPTVYENIIVKQFKPDSGFSEEDIHLLIGSILPNLEKDSEPINSKTEDSTKSAPASAGTTDGSNS